jgi:anti-sigma B factor antagonist
VYDVELLTSPDRQLRLGVEQTGGCLIVHVDGEVDYGCADWLRDRVIAAALAVPPPRLVLDLRPMGFLDSSGLGALVAIWKAIRAGGGRLIIAAAQDQCLRLIRRTGMDRHMDLAGTLAEALAALAA